MPPPIAQNADIRYLGKLLGDVIRAYGGDALFERIESHSRRPRWIATAGSPAPPRSTAGSTRSASTTRSAFVRGFMLFSMLANLAEDRQAAAHHAGDDVAAAVARLAGEGIDAREVAALLDRALIVPVLTAHPTEVMRKSMLDHRNRIAELMRLRDLGRAETRDGDLIEQAILRQIALLWQTRPLRRERLYVADEVEIALAYLRDMLLPVLPALYARWERLLGTVRRSFLRLGTWIGGDRDGNPNVTADSLRLALRARVADSPRAAIWNRCTRSAPICRSRPSWPSPSDAVAAAGRAQRRRQRGAAGRARIAARSPASMRGWRANYERVAGHPAPRPPSIDARALRLSRANCAPIWSPSRTRSRATAAGCSRPAARSGG